MRYLVAAYNTGNETNIWHVTTPSSRDQFESERQWVKTFTFRSCAANGAPAWDYTCVLDITKTMPGIAVATDPTTGTQIMSEVTVLVARAGAGHARDQPGRDRRHIPQPWGRHPRRA
jgi:hypothetical protein